MPKNAWIEAIGHYVDEHAEFFAARPALFPAAAADALTERSGAAYRRLRALLVARGDRGLIRRLHGDLHLGNIALIDGRPVPFDAIEFSPVPTDSGWLVGVTNRQVVLVSRDGAAEVWTGKLSGSPAGTPVVIGDLVVQGADAPGFELYGLALADGEVRWRRESSA